jgi:hypothetical protein
MNVLVAPTGSNDRLRQYAVQTERGDEMYSPTFDT